MLFLCWQIIRISTKHEEKITHLSIQSIKNRKFKIHENKTRKDYKQSSTGPDRLFMCETLPHWPTLLSPDCVFEDETIAVLIKTVSFLWEKKLNKKFTQPHSQTVACVHSGMYTDRHVHTCIHAHTENARGATGVSGSAEARAETEELIEVVCFTPGSLLNAMSPQCHGE